MSATTTEAATEAAESIDSIVQDFNPFEAENIDSSAQIERIRMSTLGELVKQGTAKSTLVHKLGVHYREKKTANEWKELSGCSAVACRLSELTVIFKDSPYMVYKTETNRPVLYWLDTNSRPTNIGNYQENHEKRVEDGCVRKYVNSARKTIRPVTYREEDLDEQEQQQERKVVVPVKRKKEALDGICKYIDQVEGENMDLLKRVKALEEQKGKERTMVIKGFVEHLEDFVDTCKKIVK